MQAIDVAALYKALPAAAALAALEPLAQAGHCAAQLYVGHLCDEALPRRSEEALAWYRRASGAGCVEATHCLASFLYYGFGGAQDLTQALALLRHCAAAGYAPSQLALARHLKSTPGNEAEAQLWLERLQHETDRGGAPALPCGQASSAC